MIKKQEIMKFNRENFLKLFTFFIILSSNVMWAQSEAQFTQYMYNTTIINPGYAGSRQVISIFGGYRAQWVGLDGAPKTGAFSLHAPTREDSPVGLGISFLNDRLGPSDLNTISGDFSYKIDFGYGYDHHLSFGIKASADLLNVDYTKLTIMDEQDTRFQNNIENRLSPNVGAGVYVYGDKYYAGFSIPKFLETKFYEGNTESLVMNKVTYYVMGGYVFDVSDIIKFKPTFLVKAVSGAPLQVDLSGNVMFYDKLTLGVAYRWDASVSALAGVQIGDGFFFGYSYDADTKNLGSYNSGSHEIFLRFEIINGSNIGRATSPRFF